MSSGYTSMSDNEGVPPSTNPSYPLTSQPEQIQSPLYGTQPQYAPQIQPQYIIQQPLYALSPPPRTSPTANWCLILIHTLSITALIICLCLPLYGLEYHHTNNTTSMTKGYWNRLLDQSGSASYAELARTFQYSNIRYATWADNCDTESKPYVALISSAIITSFLSLMLVGSRTIRQLDLTPRIYMLERVLLILSKAFLIFGFYLFYRGCIEAYPYTQYDTLRSANVKIGAWPLQLGTFAIMWVGTFILCCIRSSVVPTMYQL